MPSCITCNQPGDGGIGKRNRFPVEEKRYAASDEEIRNEQPLLLNPLDPHDDPEEHFVIDLEKGILSARNSSARGNMCVKVFGLNVRDQLVRERKSAIKEVKAIFAELLNTTDDAKAQEYIAELKAMEHGEHNHTLGRRAQIRLFRSRYQQV